MAGTLSVNRTKFTTGNLSGDKFVVDWTSDASGNADIAIKSMNGFLIKLVTDPAATAPTDDYDVTLIDSHGADALSGTGLNRDTANSETVYTLVSGAATPIFLQGDHTFTVANAGNAKVGQAIFYVLHSL